MDEILCGTRVVVRNGNIERALSKFKKKVNDSEKLVRLRQLQEYQKPSAKRRAVKQKAIRKLKKEDNY